MPTTTSHPWLSTRGIALTGILLLALAVRLGALFTQTYVIFADETFQYLEQGHRLAFGNGIVPWEYHDGIRSWLLPAAIAALMRLGALLDLGPLGYVRLVRGACILLSLSVAWVGFRMAERRGGLGPALLAGGFCAIWFDLVWFAPAVLTETVAAHLVILAIGLGDAATHAPAGRADGQGVVRHARGHGRTRDGSRGTLLAAGACLGLAACLRYQYAPAIAAVAVLQYRLSWTRWRPALAGGIAVVALCGGLLDWVTWGLPFQSVWLHFLRNTLDGVGSAIGTDPATFYVAYLAVALWPAPLLLLLAGLGATRAPVLAVVAVLTLLVHTLVPHKEVRFVYLALAVAPILIALGAAALLARFHRHHPAWIVLLLLAWAGLSWHGAVQPALANRWSFNRPAIEAFLAASRLPDLCGLAVRDLRLIDTGGHVYLHRDVPLFFEDSTAEVALPNSRVTLRFSAERAGRPEPLRPIPPQPMPTQPMPPRPIPGQPSSGQPPPTQGGYNAVIAAADHAEAGFIRLGCFDAPAHQGRPQLCLFHDPTRRCDPP